MIGAIASGRVAAYPTRTDLAVRTGPTSLLIGALFVAVCAYLAAVFLTEEASRRGDDRLRRYFARRAGVAGAISGVLSLATLLEVRHSAPALAALLVGPSFLLLFRLQGRQLLEAEKHADSTDTPGSRAPGSTSH